MWWTFFRRFRHNRLMVRGAFSGQLQALWLWCRTRRSQTRWNFGPNLSEIVGHPLLCTYTHLRDVVSIFSLFPALIGRWCERPSVDSYGFLWLWCRRSQTRWHFAPKLSEVVGHPLLCTYTHLWGAVTNFHCFRKIPANPGQLPDGCFCLLECWCVSRVMAPSGCRGVS